MLSEIAEVLSRPKVRALAPALTLEKIVAFIVDIRMKSICLQNIPEEYFFERDPKDTPYINLAIVAGASYLVSRDNDLLDLMRSETEEARSFRTRYPLLSTLDAPSFLNRMREGSN